MVPGVSAAVVVTEGAGDDPPAGCAHRAGSPVLVWHKRKWRCRVPECDRQVFTESLPEDIPARARITTRARRAAAVSIGDHCRPVSGVAAECGMDWNIAHDAFAAATTSMVLRR